MVDRGVGWEQPVPQPLVDLRLKARFSRMEGIETKGVLR